MYKAEFHKLEWTVGKGSRYKEYVRGGRKLRLVEFDEHFEEEGWCSKGHIGYILEGTMNLNFNGNIINYTAGDALWIEPGEEHKHKVEVPENEKVQIILFEKEEG